MKSPAASIQNSEFKMQTVQMSRKLPICILHFAFCIQVAGFFRNLLGERRAISVRPGTAVESLCAVMNSITAARKARWALSRGGLEGELKDVGIAITSGRHTAGLLPVLPKQDR